MSPEFRGLYYRARYYDPTLGRFTQRDPIGLQGGLNAYAYVGNNPANLRDPFGDRPLTEGEIGLLTPIFHGTVDYKQVDVQQGANWNPIAGVALYIFGASGITLGNTVYLNPRAYQGDFSKAQVGPQTQSILVHETAHVWQKQRNPEYSEIKAGTESWFKTDTYGYELSPSNPSTMAGPMKSLTSYGGYEQQAQIIQDYFLVSHGQEPWGNRNAAGVDPEALQSGYEQTIGPSGLGQQAYVSPSNSSPGDQSLRPSTEPVPGGRSK